MRNVKKIFLLSLGLLSLVLGIIGIFLPLLPTTPFLLLSAFCFARSSVRFHNWLMKHPVLSPPLRDWQDRGVIRTGPKVMATTMLSISGAFLFFSERAPVVGKAAFAVCASLVLLFLWTRKSS